MTKISILFKPAEWSGITNILFNNFFIIVPYNDFKERNVKWLQRLIIDKVPSEKLSEIMENRNDLFHPDWKILLCSSIASLEL